MNDEQFNDLDLPDLPPMTDAEIAQELYRYLVLILESERLKERPRVLHGPN